MREAIKFHLDGLRAEGQPIPAGGTFATYVEVAA
jgi:predicted RNase H-like HicB family nuclease